MDAMKPLQDRRVDLAKRANDLREAVKASDAGFDGDQRSAFDAIVNEINEIDSKIKTVEADKQRMSQTLQLENATPQRQDETPVDKSEALRGWMLSGTGEATQNQVNEMKRAGIEPGQKSISLKAGTKRALSAGTTTAGGFSVANELMGAITDALLAYGGIREACTVLKTKTGADLPMPMSNDSSNSAALLAEAGTVAEQNAGFTSKTFGAYKFSSLQKCSRELVVDSSIGIESWLGEQMGTRIARAFNNYATVGTGSSQPSGIVTDAADSGVTLASATAITYAEIVSVFHSVDPEYRNSAGCAWMLSDTILKFIRSLVDSNGLPLWQPAMVAGSPDTILGKKFTVNQDVPSATGEKCLLFGDISKFIMREVDDYYFVKLTERYADSDELGFAIFARMDSGLLDAGTNPVKYATNG